MGRRKKGGGDEGPKGDEWLATYSDCITLLLTFFILLYSMSTVDGEKLERLSTAFNEMMLGTKGDSIHKYNLYDGEVPLIGGENSEDSKIDGEVSNNSVYEEIKSFTEEKNIDDLVEVTEDERGIILQIRDNILFGTGKANLKEKNLRILDEISNILKEIPNSIVVEGHTDNVPISTNEYRNNFELSSARALSVVNYFIGEKKQNPAKFSAAGYGEHRPVVSNSSNENKAKNRRVNILIVADKETKK